MRYSVAVKLLARVYVQRRRRVNVVEYNKRLE